MLMAAFLLIVGAVLVGLVLCAVFLWWDFCAWRKENAGRLSRRHWLTRHWLTNGDFPDCNPRTGKPLTEEDVRDA